MILSQGKVGNFGCHINLEDYLRDYYDEDLSGKSPLTVSARLSDLKKFVAHYEMMNGHQKVDEWRPLDTRSFLDSMLNQSYQANSINRHIASIRAFGRYLLLKGAISLDPCKGVRDLQTQPLAPKAVRDLEYHRLKKAADVLIRNDPADYSQDFRNLVIMEVLTASALRITELLNLRYRQFQGRKLIGVLCKGGKVRDILLPLASTELLKKYLQKHRVQGTDYLVTNRYGHRLSRNSVAEAFKKIAGYANATLPANQQTHLSPHRLRHRAGYLARKIKDDVFAQRRLGHSSTRYIERYANFNDDEEAELLEQM